MKNTREKVRSVKKSKEEIEETQVPAIRKRAPYSYTHISNEKRQELVDRVTTNGEKILKVAKDLKINYSTAKTILQVFKKTGRTEKIPHRMRKVREKSKPSPSSKASVSRVENSSTKRENSEQCDGYFGDMKTEDPTFGKKGGLNCEENFSKIKKEANEWKHEQEPKALENQARNNFLAAYLHQRSINPLMQFTNQFGWNLPVSYLNGVCPPNKYILQNLKLERSQYMNFF